MNLKAIPQLLKYPLLSLALATGILSCKKEYTELPYNDIETFTIEDANGKPLHAVIKDEDIIIYWTPLKTDPEFITPTIRVSQGAQVGPASGEKVSYSETTKYTVTAQNGQKKTYTLRTQGGQPKPYFSLVADLAFRFNNLFAIQGDYFLPDSKLTKLYLVRDNKETAITDIRRLTNSNIHAYIPITLDIDTGQYHIKLVTGRHSVSIGPHTFLRPDLYSLIDRAQIPASGTPGETISLDLRDTKGASYYKEEQYEVTVHYGGVPPEIVWSRNVKVEGTKLNIKIPSDAPKGTVYIQIYDSKTRAIRYQIPDFVVK